ncbi:MAG: hypothetical protein ACE5HC_16995 [Candidatus Binatia bacterium]
METKKAIETLRGIIDYHSRFHGGLQGCIDCLADALSGGEVYEALVPSHDENSKKHERLFDAINDALPSDELKKTLTDLDNLGVSELVAQGEISLLVGLLAGFQWGGVKPESADNLLGFMTREIEKEKEGRQLRSAL